ncbi:MAG TPA: ATP-dependent sacrificial sulfur transferase LarE [Pirellulales bacterium]|nr:ATP-dependent sacrificial sulfur transferase LarE [Pirellulales bacterium]
MRQDAMHRGPTKSLLPDVADKRDRLLELIAGYGSCAVAFSGGVDSAVVAKAAQLALGDQAVAVTGTSASLAEGELAAALELAEQIGIRHQVLETEEFGNADYLRNAPDRCFHCKTELYTRLEGQAEKLGVQVIVNGANLDDRGDYRPGMLAAREHDVRSPLIECRLTKAEVRELAAHWGLPVWDKPASPCLSSRIAYGQQVTSERVAMIDRAEQFLREQGFRELRVRYHGDDLARIEVPAGELPRLAAPEFREALVGRFRELGFKYVTLDLEGFRSGSLNQIIGVDDLKVIRR